MPIETIGNNTGGSANTYSGVVDTFINADEATTVHASNDFLGIGKYSVGSHANALLRFDGLNNIEGPVVVNEARLYLSPQAGDIGPGVTLSARELLRDVGDMTATTWNAYSSGNSWTTSGGLGAGTDRESTVLGTINITSSAAGYVYLSGAGLDAYIQECINGNVPASLHLERTDAENDERWLFLSSSEDTNGVRPYLYVDWDEDAGDQTVTPSGVATDEAHGTAVVANATPQSATPSGIATDETFGAATVANAATQVSPTGFGSDEAFGSVTIANATPQSISPTGVVTAEVFGTAELGSFMTVVLADPIYTGPGSIAHDSDFSGTPVAGDTVRYPTTNGFEVAPNGMVSADTPTGSYVCYYNDGGGEVAFTVTLVSLQTVEPTGLTSAEVFGDVTIDSEGGEQSISLSGIATDEAFGSAVIASADTQVVAASSVDTAEAFGAVAIANGTPQIVTASAVDSLEAFGAHTLGQVGQSISVSGIASLETFPTPTVNILVQTITPNGIVTAAAFGTSVLTGGAEPPQAAETGLLFVPLWR